MHQRRPLRAGIRTSSLLQHRLVAAMAREPGGDLRRLDVD